MIVQYAAIVSCVPNRSARACMLVPCQQFAQKAKKLIRQCATISDEPVVFMDLSLAIYTLRVDKKPLLSLLSIESEEGGGDQQMTPELLIKAFSAKSHNSYNLNAVRNLITSHLRLPNEVCSR